MTQENLNNEEPETGKEKPKEIDIGEATKAAEIAVAEKYNVGEPIGEGPKEFYPFVSLKNEGDKIAGKLLAKRGRVGKSPHVYDFELTDGQKVTLNGGLKGLDDKMQKEGPGGEDLIEVGKSYLVSRGEKIHLEDGNDFVKIIIQPLTD